MAGSRILHAPSSPIFHGLHAELLEISYATIGTVFAISYIVGNLPCRGAGSSTPSCSQLVVAFVVIPLFGLALRQDRPHRHLYPAACGSSGPRRAQASTIE